MYDRYSRPGVSYSSGFFFLLALAGGGLIISTFLTAGIWYMVTGKGVISIQQDMLKPENAVLLRWIQVITTALSFMVPAIIGAWLVSKKPFRFLGYNQQWDWRQVALVCLIMLTGTVVAGSLSELTQLLPFPEAYRKNYAMLEKQYVEQVKVIAPMNSVSDLMLAMTIVALLPALFEETLFRGAMQGMLTRNMKNAYVAILITSILFSAIHLSVFGFLSRVALGLFLGLIFYYSGNLWLAIIAHFFNNGMALVQMYIYKQQGKDLEKAMEETYPVWWGLLALPVLYFLFRFFREVSRDVQAKHKPKEDLALEEQWLTGEQQNTNDIV
jgi:uncharacterized protein